MSIEKTFQTNYLDSYHSLKYSWENNCAKENINGGIVVSKRVFCRHAKDLTLEFEPKNVEGRWKSEGTRARAHTQYTYSYGFFFRVYSYVY